MKASHLIVARLARAVAPSFIAGSAMAATPEPSGTPVRAAASEPSGTDALATASAATGAPSDDLVEKIDATPLVEPAPARPGLAPLHLEAGGWAKQRIEYFPNDTPPAPGREDAVGRTDLFVRSRYAPSRHFEVNVSGSLSHTLSHGASGTRGAFEPMLREAFVGLFSSVLDVRIGQQRLSWGNTDFLSPNDVVNARDLRDPFLGEQDLRFIPTPMVRADVSSGILTVQGVYSPWFVPDRFDLYGTNWAGVQPSAPASFQQRARAIVDGHSPSLFDQAQRLYQQTSLPDADYTRPSAGGQVALNGSGFDLAFYYHYGFDGPFVALDASSALQATYLRRHHVGMAASTPAGPLVLRAEGAYDSQRAFFRTDLLSHKSPSLQAAGAVEWETGDTAKVALLELRYQHIVTVDEVPLLAWTQDSYGAGLSLKWPLFGPLRTDSRVLVGIRPVTTIARPELELAWGAWVVGAGALLVAGQRPSFGWYYRNNDEAYAFVKCLF